MSQQPATQRDREIANLPPRVFLYTLDQIESMVQIPVSTLKQSFVHFEGRTVGQRRLDRLRAVNIAPDTLPPEWRVTDEELIRWLKRKGFRVTERAWIR